MNLSGNTVSVLHVHLTRKCNLPCLQCLAYSGPQRLDEIEPALLRRAIGEAFEIGYNMLSVAGGEPLLYSGLDEVLAEAGSHGMLTDVITNGLLLTESKIAELRPVLDSVTVNVERAPKSQRQLQAVDRYVDILTENFSALRSAGVPFTIRFTLTRENAGELPWVAEFALSQGARMLQVRPLELTGSMRKLAGLVPNGESAALAWLVVDLLRNQYRSELPIHFDMFDCEQAGFGGARSIADGSLLPSPLVIETDGTIVPLRCGFPRPFAIGNVSDGPLAGLLWDWASRCGDVVQAVVGATLEALSEPRPYPFVNLSDCLSERAFQATEVMQVAPRGNLACRQEAYCH